MKKALTLSITTAVLLGAYFSENIYGYFRFKSLCARESGLHVNEFLERDVGWAITEGQVNYALHPLSIPEVAFVRYRNREDGLLYDVYRESKTKVSDQGYIERKADLNLTAVYHFHWRQERVQGEIRLSTINHEVIDLRTQRIAANYRTFGYEWFDRFRTLLAMPSGVECPANNDEIDTVTGGPLPTMELAAYSKMFKPAL